MNIRQGRPAKPLAMAALVLTAAGLSHGAVPNISGITNAQVTHASVLWRYQVSAASRVQIKYGVTSGVYPYATQSYTSGLEGGQWAVIPVSGLQPGTTYYFRMTARPNADDDIDICETDSCGSVEQVLTTAPEPGVHPELPAPPAVYKPSHPDTSGYTIVPLRVHTDGSCVAAQNVGSQAGWTAGVTAGDSLQVVLNKVGYGTAIEFPQQTECKVFEQNTFWHYGYVLPNKALDPNAGGDIHSPNHRWIVLRTARGDPSDFPPYGFRTGPAWASKMAKLTAQTPGYLRPDNSPNYVGQIFHGVRDSAGSPHHYWIENVELTHARGSSVFPDDVVDPVPFTDLILVKDASYVVLDRIYAHGGGFPERIAAGIWAGGTNSAVIGCHFAFDYWRMAVWPKVMPTLTSSDNTLTIPAQVYKRNYFDQETGMTQPAAFRLIAPTDLEGKLTGYLGADGLTIEYTDAAGATGLCSGCVAKAVASPTVPLNRYPWFSAKIVNGKITGLAGRTAEWQTTGRDWAPWGFTLGWGAKMVVENNHLEGPGQTVYIEPDGNRDDVVFRRNFIYWPQDHLPRIDNPKWNGLRYNVRNPFEMKRGRRWLMDGNIFDGAWSHENQGQPIMIVSSGAYTATDLDVGTMDITVSNNVVRNAAVVGQTGGLNGWSYTKRVLIENNLAYNLNRDFWDDGWGSPGVYWSGHWMLSEAPEDFTMRNNTFGPARGLGPAILFAGGPGGPGEGLNVHDNLFYMDLGSGSPHGPVMLYESQRTPSHPRKPAFKNGTARDILCSVFLRTAESVNPSCRLANNLFLAGYTRRGSATWRDITQAETNTYAEQLRPENFVPDGETAGVREAAAGLSDPSRNDYRLTSSSPFRSGGTYAATSGGNIGVDYSRLESALGLVSNVKVSAAVTSALVEYTAPDGKACHVETSLDGSAWSRKVDGGGNRSRKVLADNLLPSFSYRYRILCYFEQLRTGTNSDDYRDDQITAGVFSTPADSGNSQTTASIQAAPPPELAAVKVRAEYGTTPQMGSQTDAIPCAGRCVVTVSARTGEFLYYQLRYLDADNHVLGSGGSELLLVR